MQLYPKPSKDLVYDLIMEGNPSSPYPITAANVNIGAPLVITPVPPATANTRARISPVPNGPYRGNMSVDYRRISVAQLFNGTTVRITKYSAVGETGGIPFTLYQLIPFINSQYGVNFTEDDLTAINFPAFTNVVENGITYKQSQVTAVVKATSQAYIGQFVVQCRQGKRELLDVIKTTELPARVYPGGNDFSVGSKYRLNCDSFSMDFTSQAADCIRAGAGIPLGDSSYNGDATAAADRLFATINNKRGTNYRTSWDKPAESTQLQSMYATRGTVYTIPNALVPEANSELYNRVLVLPVMLGGLTWGAGALYLHYNA